LVEIGLKMAEKIADRQTDIRIRPRIMQTSRQAESEIDQLTELETEIKDLMNQE
jgi:hypothetical protein